MLRTLAFSLLLLTQCFTHYAVAQQRDSTNIQRAFMHYGVATQAFRARDLQKYYSELEKVNKYLPYHAAIIYNAAQAAFLASHADVGKQKLETIIGMGTYFDLAADTTISKRLPESELSAIVARMNSNKNTVATGQRAFEIPELDLAIEGIAHDPKSGSFFVSSIHKQKILRIDKKGVISDFSKPADSLLGVYGMHSDGKYLWACNIAVPQCIGYEKMKDKRSFISVYDLKSGKLLNKIYLTSPNSQIKDVTTTSDGVVYFTDMRENLVYELKKDQSPKAITTPAALGNSLGITSSGDGRYLFIADHLQGVMRLERSTGKLTLIKPFAGSTLQGIDGVYCSGNKLVAVQNGRGFSRTISCTLNAAMDEVTAMKVTDSWHADHDWPTLGVVARKKFYYVANSQWNNFSAKGTINQPSKSKPTYILSNTIE